tara:strand:+ start:643 stop:1584 length:942 start_codon:yes stop_codon:yes gene_type:complete
MSEVENEAQAPEETLATMPGSDSHPMDDDQTGMSLDFSDVPEETTPELEPEPEPVAAEAEQEEVEAEATPEPVVDEKKEHMIPKTRLDEALQKQRALQKQLDDMQKEQFVAPAEPDTYDFESKELEYQELVLDGENKKAALLRQEIRHAEKQALMFEMQQNVNATVDQTVNQTKQGMEIEDVAEELARKYPTLDPEAKEFNEGYIDEVIELRDAFIGKGYEPADALIRSVKYIVADHNIPESGTTTQPQQDELAKKRAQVAAKLEAAEQQPPDLVGEGSSTKGQSAVDIATLSDDEFAALPAATLARLRGDIV